MSYLIFLIGMIAGSLFTILMTREIAAAIPDPQPSRPPADEGERQIDEIMAWNQAILNVPRVDRPMVFEEWRH
jgi:hypothetical protein